MFHQDPSLFKLLRLYKLRHAAFHQDPDLFKLLRLYKSWALCKFLILGQPFQPCVWLWFNFPLSSSHFIVLVHLGCLDGASRTALDTNFLIRCISPMSSVSRLSHPFHLPVPPIWNLLLPLICLNVSLYICTIWPVLAILPSPLCS